MNNISNKVLCLDDFEEIARRRLPHAVYQYIAGGTERNSSLDANSQAYEDITFTPRILVDITKRSTTTKLFGHEYIAPFGIAPMGLSALSAYRGDMMLARGANAQIPIIISGSSLIPLEELSSFSPTAWFQAYLPGRLEQIDGLITRIRQAGFKTLVITVDTATAANRENNLRAGFSTPLRITPPLIWDVITHPRWLVCTWIRTLLQHGMPHFENSYATRGEPILSKTVLRDFSDRGHLSWDHFKHIRDQWDGNLVIKGVLHPKDAALACQHGVDGIIVSNHGGRQLDGAAAPLRILPDIVAAAGHIPVMIDSGIRRGSDVLKALSLGARFVFIGRPFQYAAVVGGASGVRHAIHLLQTEVYRNMALLGINSIDEADNDLLSLKQ